MRMVIRQRPGALDPLNRGLGTLTALGVHVALGTLVAAAPAFAEADDVPRARALLAEAAIVAGGIHDTGPRAGLLGEIAGAQARAGDEQAALATATRAGSLGWGPVAAGFAAGGNLGAALAAARRIEPSDVDRRLGTNFARDAALLQIVQQCAKGNDVRGASLALREIRSPAVAGMAQVTLAEAHARAGHPREAAAAFRRAAWKAERARWTLLGAAGPAAVYQAIGEARGRLGDRAQAITAFDKALAAARGIRGEYQRDNVIAAIAAERAIAGDFDGTVRTLAHVRNPRQALEARAVLARSLAAAGQPDRAMETAGGIVDETGRMRAFLAIATVAASGGDAALAIRAWEQAVAAAEQRPADRGPGFSLRDEALLEVARAQARSGDRDAALRTTARMARQGPPRDAYVLDAVLEASLFALAQTGEVDAALAAAGSARLYSPGAEVWRAIGAAAGRQGAVDAVRARGPAWQDTGPRAMFLLGLAEGLIEHAATEGTARHRAPEIEAAYLPRTLLDHERNLASAHRLLRPRAPGC